MRAKLHYEIAGRGPRVVLLHPVGLDLTFLVPVAAVLRSAFTVLCIDLRGHGRSPAWAPACSLEDYADDVHALLRELGFAPAAIVGFSFGGMVAQTFALNYPDDVSALIPCACPGTLQPEARNVARSRGDDARRQHMAGVLEATLDRWFTPQFRAKGETTAAQARLLSDNVESWAEAWYAMAEIDTVPRLHAIRAPTLCIAGELDKSSPPAVVKTIADAIPGARYVVLSGAPHMLFIEYPEETARHITEFLRAVLPRD